jgi:cytochrome c oxidase assembly protein subunit 15
MPLQSALSNKKPIAIWLLSGCFLIFMMVIVGGITRLTGSGLSITEWKPVVGAIPPMNEEQWQAEFDKYKQIPQFQKINYNFTLSDFKQIYFWEYLHRLIGRIIGIVFILPFLYFLGKKMIDNRMMKKAMILFFLGALQGLIGWLMVRTGLDKRTSVSHIALAIHLIAAFITFGVTFYFALQILFIDKVRETSRSNIHWINSLLVLVIIQIIYGAFVAGLHAGKIYNTFPLMNGKIIPEGIDAFPSLLDNVLNNPVTVQFIHRFFAGIISIISLLLFFRLRKPGLSIAVNILMLALSIQVILGIVTLLTSVNIVVASLHQVGAFFLFAAVIYLRFSFERFMIKDNTASAKTIAVV